MAQVEATAYCIRQQTGEQLTGNIADQVDVLVKSWKDHGNAKLARGGRTLRGLMRDAENALESCAPDQAKKVDDALAGH